MCSTIVRNFYLYAPTFSFVSALQMSIWVWMFSKSYIWSSVWPLQHVLSSVEPLWQSIISQNEVAALCCTCVSVCDQRGCLLITVGIVPWGADKGWGRGACRGPLCIRHFICFGGCGAWHGLLPLSEEEKLLCRRERERDAPRLHPTETFGFHLFSQ